MKVIAGEDVKWQSATGNGTWLKGKVKKVLGEVAFVEDKTGLGPRHVMVERLYPIVSRRQRFAGSLA